MPTAAAQPLDETDNLGPAPRSQLFCGNYNRQLPRRRCRDGRPGYLVSVARFSELITEFRQLLEAGPI